MKTIIGILGLIALFGFVAWGAWSTNRMEHRKMNQMVSHWREKDK